MRQKTILTFLLIISAAALAGCDSGALTTTSWPGLIATEENVYLAFGPHVFALDANTGSEAWRFPAEPDNSINFYAAPAISDDGRSVIAGAYDNNLYSINIDTGQAGAWSFTGAGNRYIGSILTTPDGIFVPNASGNLFALDYSGEALWDRPYNTGQPQWSAPSTDGETLYLTALDHQLHAVDIQSGMSRWVQDLGTASTGTPVLADGVLYTGTFGSTVFAIDMATGDILWTFETADWVWAAPAVNGNLVFAGDISGTLYAIDAATGRETWEFKADGGIFGAPLVVENQVFFGTENGKFYALSMEGETEWFTTIIGKIYSQPVFNGEYLIVAAIEGDTLLTALDLNGTAKWQFTPSDED